MARARPHYPPRPPCLTRSRLLADGGHGEFDVNEDLIEQMRGFGELASEEADVLLSEHRQWEVACSDVDAAYGVVAAKEADAACRIRYDAAEQRFIKAPVRTVEDIGLKLRFLADIEDYDCESSMTPAKLVYAMMRDIKAGNVA